MIGEPVRGGFPDPGVMARPGLERLRLLPLSPLQRLTGMRGTQFGPGSATGTLPASPWLIHDMSLEVTIVAGRLLHTAVVTGLPPHTDVRTAVLSIHHLRPTRPEDGAVIGRARVIKSGRDAALAEIWLEDGSGRAVAHATGSLLIEPVKPVDRAGADEGRGEGPGPPPDEPRYATPDPWERPGAPPSKAFDEVDGLTRMRSVCTGELPMPVLDLIGGRFTHVGPGEVRLTLPASEWLCADRGRVASAVLAALSSITLAGAAHTVAGVGVRPAPLAQTIRFLGWVDPHGGDLTAAGRVTDAHGQTVLSCMEILDRDGRVVARGEQSAVLRERGGGRTAPVQRILTTVMLTDLVGSTTMARELGDRRWGELLDEHHRLVRRMLGLHQGREIKTTGDGFLATFEAPTRAMQCAAAIRDGLRALGLEVRIGVHTGECEFSEGDVSGVAVHVASRLESVAQPGQVITSTTVRDLIAGSEVALVPAGTHQLKGLDGDWALFAL